MIHNLYFRRSHSFHFPNRNWSLVGRFVDMIIRGLLYPAQHVMDQ